MDEYPRRQRGRHHQHPDPDGRCHGPHPDHRHGSTPLRSLRPLSLSRAPAGWRDIERRQPSPRHHPHHGRAGRAGSQNRCSIPITQADLRNRHDRISHPAPHDDPPPAAAPRRSHRPCRESPARSPWEIITKRSTFMLQRFNTAIPSNRARLDAVEQLAAVADQAGLTLIQLALGFVTTHRAVTSAIIGPRTTEHLHSQPAAAAPSCRPTCSTQSTRSLRPASTSPHPRRTTPRPPCSTRHCGAADLWLRRHGPRGKMGQLRHDDEGA